MASDHVLGRGGEWGARPAGGCAQPRRPARTCSVQLGAHGVGGGLSTKPASPCRTHPGRQMKLVQGKDLGGGSPCIIVSQGCPNNIPHPRGFERQTFTLPDSWRPEVPNPGVCRTRLPPEALEEALPCLPTFWRLQKSVAALACVHLTSVCALVFIRSSLSPRLIRTLVTGFRAHLANAG